MDFLEKRGKSLEQNKSVNKESFKSKVCHSPRGRELAKKMIKCDIGGRGSKSKCDVTPSKNIISNK